MLRPSFVVLNSFKVVLLGGDSVGKSWLLHRCVHGLINQHILATIGACLSVKKVNLEDGTQVELLIFDTAGSARYDGLSSKYCNGAHAIIVVYDITKEPSFEKAKNWVRKIQEMAIPKIFLALVGNKADLEANRKVKREDAQSYAESNGIDLFTELSAKSGGNTEDFLLAIGYNLKQARISVTDLKKAIDKNNKALDLGRRKLVRVPDSVAELREVQTLNLSENNLTQLPRYLKNLENVTMLILSQNKLKRLPDVIIEMTNLICLNVSDNQLSCLPKDIKRLQKLQALELRNNRLQRLDVDISCLKRLEKLSVNGNPLDFGAVRSLMGLKEKYQGRIHLDIAVPAEILAQGPVAKQLYEDALKDGSVIVCRARILIIGQDRAGKTSLKKSLLGQPFDPDEQSTDGIEVDPSECTIEVDQIKNWNPTGKNESCLGEYSEEISRMLAEKRYQWILKIEETESEGAPYEEPKQEQPVEDSNIKDENEIPCTEDSPKSQKVYSSTSEKQDDETENQTRGCSQEKRGDCASMEFESELIPDTVVEHADRLLKEMINGKDRQSPQDDKESIMTIDLWDFAGQHLYYAAHSVFFTARAVYILVHNLSKELNALAQPCVRQGCHNIILENPGRVTNLEDLLSWLATIHSIKPKDEGTPVDNSDTLISYRRPPVFIVGTHADQPIENTETVKEKIQQAVSGKEYGKHVIPPLLNIDNTQSHQSLIGKTQQNKPVQSILKRLFSQQSQGSHQRGKSGEKGRAIGDEIHTLRAKIMEVLRKEPYMGERIPIRWFNFEKLVETLVAGNVYFMNMEQLQTVVEKANIIDGDEHFKTMLNFYHDLGMIVKHRSTVILKAQWLIDLFRKLITIPPFDKMDPVESKHWHELERNGFLSMELVDRVFSKFLRQGVIKEDILDMMELFGLIAKFSSPSLPDVKYFVPCQLRSPPEELRKMEPSSTDPCPLYVHFLDGFVPHGLFPRLVSRTTASAAGNELSHLQKLYQNGAWFVLEGNSIHDMILICQKRFIKILLRERKEAKAVPVSLSPSTSADVARSVKLFLESSLEHFSQEFPYLSKLRYEFSVECPYCLQRVQECAIHRKSSCAHEDCLHLLEIKQGKRLICMESVGCSEVLTVQGQDLWFSSGGTEDSCKTDASKTSWDATARIYPVKCASPLRVTLLASEWGSSMGGLSTINRQLAILLAKRREIEVTFLVPKFNCSEEDKRTAWNHNVLIKEAEKLPGFDPLDWLSFPPKELIIDVVLGHGAKLGKQAQVIRESHRCQWVQVVHTAPEELGMFKTHPRAVAKGEQKNTTEVDLCKLANIVVAVGPKLTEAYSAYLRSSEKQQDIFMLTPGTFKEFSTLKHAPVDSEKFRVLTFGRGDPEDFALKGYDITAKAIAELDDNSYHLIFVGAPDGKQEAVKERLLQSGISSRQLTVRKFLQCRERLRECFCEVDLCIMPSRTEGFGLTALEALSAGLPILVSGNSGFGDALRKVPSGKSFVVDSEDPKVWAEAITVVRKKKRPERLQETQRLQTSYEEQFSWEKQCNLLVYKMWNKVHGAGPFERIIQDLQQMHFLASKVNSNTYLTEELTKIASDKGFRISDNQESGNCMFHALSEQLETVKGIKIENGQLRQSLVQYLRENPKLADGTDLCHFVHGHETWDDYLTYVEHDGAWGDHLILCAAANCFETCIHVVSSLHNDVVIRPHSPVDESKPLVLGHIHEVHYVSLQPIQG